MINKERLKNNFLDLVQIPSPSLKERAVADFLKSQLTSLGLEVFEDEAGNCKEMYCPNGQIFDISTMKCKKLECPENAVLQPDGSCKRK